MKIYVLIIFISTLLSFIYTYSVLQIDKKFKFFFPPIRKRDIHTNPISRIGGIAISMSCITALLLSTKIPFTKGIFVDNSKAVIGIIFSILIIMFIGLIDDIYGLHWIFKLIGQIISSIFVVYQGIYIMKLPLNKFSFNNQISNILITIFLLVITMNAINFIDGLDGLATGVVYIGSLAFFICTYSLARKTEQSNYFNLSALIASILIGTCIGFIPYNFYPAKIFMGDTGSMTLGLLLSSSTITATGHIDSVFFDKNNFLASLTPVLLPISICLLPLLDLFLAIIRRILNGQSPFRPDKLHLHHKLINIGLSHIETVLLMYLWSFVIAFGVIFLVFFSWMQVIIIDLFLIIIVILFTFYLSYKK